MQYNAYWQNDRKQKYMIRIESENFTVGTKNSFSYLIDNESTKIYQNN